jgi:sugar phosphate isomerase/epimerase
VRAEVKTHPLGIEFLSVFGLPPVELVDLAADLGCQHISTALTAYPGESPYGYEQFSLRKDAALRSAMRERMADRGVTIALGEGFSLKAGGDARDYAADLDLMVELGAERINTIAIDPDLGRVYDQLGVLTELVAERRMTLTLETAPGLPIGDLPSALHAIAQVGRPELQLLIDTMHVLRSGSTPADVAALDPALIGYVQLSDVPLVSPYESYFDEAMQHRLCPGDGELPLRELLGAIPDGVVVSLEVPNLEEAQSGLSPRQRVERYIAATRHLLDG